jgi:hypothetical protein
MTRDMIIAVCLGALLSIPLTMWLHVRLSAVAERSRLLSWAAMASFLLAWLSLITFVITVMMLGAVLFLTRGS